VVSYVSGALVLFDIETGSLCLEFDTDTTPCAIYDIACHDVEPIVVTACANNELRFFNTITGKCEHIMTAHGDAVTSVSFDSSGLFLVSAGNALCGRPF